jgi:hypothetical protein
MYGMQQQILVFKDPLKDITRMLVEITFLAKVFAHPVTVQATKSVMNVYHGVALRKIHVTVISVITSTITYLPLQLALPLPPLKIHVNHAIIHVLHVYILMKPTGNLLLEVHVPLVQMDS